MLVNLNEVLYDAQKHHYGVGLFNTTDTDMLEAVIEAAERKRSPVIIGTAEILLPYGELALIAPSTIEAAKRASVPVVVHYDHGLTFERCMEAIKLGYSSVMFDGSVKPYAQNIEETREIVRIAHAFGATVEGEIGHVGSAVNGEDQSRYTTVEEAKQRLNSEQASREETSRKAAEQRAAEHQARMAAGQAQIERIQAENRAMIERNHAASRAIVEANLAASRNAGRHC